MNSRTPFVVALLQSIICLVVAGFLIIVPAASLAQAMPAKLFKVLTLTGKNEGVAGMSPNKGLNGIWQKLLKLTTTASAMHTQAHPDDEDAGLLTYLSRGKGVRTSLLSLNRGEGGANIAGAESFDRLALLRTEEFLLACSYYGLDDLYFTNLADYGYSKRVEEAYEKWGKQNVLEEMVRVIRINRPFVIISRFQGMQRDGHGNHRAAGEISQQAYQLAGDPDVFPEQITHEGLRPWKAIKYYYGGLGENEPWNVALNAGEYCSWLGDSYENFSLLGYSFHRSQFGGQLNRAGGDFLQYFKRMQDPVANNEKEKDFFAGIDVSVPGIFTVTGEKIPPGMLQELTSIKREVEAALATFTPDHPMVVIYPLTKALSATRAAIKLANSRPEALFILQIKERQLMDAINTVAAIDVQAIAMPADSKESTSFYEPPATLGFVVPGQTFKVNVSVINRYIQPITFTVIKLNTPAEWPKLSGEPNSKILIKNEQASRTFHLTVPSDAGFTQPYYYRASIQDAHYQSKDSKDANLPGSAPAIMANVSYLINGEVVEMEQPVLVRQANLPYGYNTYTLKVAPAVAVNLEPSFSMLSKGTAKEIDIEAEVVTNQDSTKGELKLKLPPGWKCSPVQIPFAFAKAGERSKFMFKVLASKTEAKSYEIQGVAVVKGKTYTQGYILGSHRYLEQTILYRPALTTLKGIDAAISPDLSVGYIMGVGDEVPLAIKQLGARVRLLTSETLATDNLQQFDAIVVGTRAYAVRPDLHTYTFRLLQYAKTGGHLIILFQTPEFVPGRMAPYAAELPPDAEEISEENSPMEILQPGSRVLSYPNKITLADFDDWVEQRGSKFFSKWDSLYTPVLSTHDVGQLPQSGGWLMAPYGKGFYTYFAYSLHRQLPYGVAGAYRILANLLSYGKR